MKAKHHVVDRSNHLGRLGARPRNDAARPPQRPAMRWAISASVARVSGVQDAAREEKSTASERRSTPSSSTPGRRASQHNTPRRFGPTGIRYRCVRTFSVCCVVGCGGGGSARVWCGLCAGGMSLGSPWRSRCLRPKGEALGSCGHARWRHDRLELAHHFVSERFPSRRGALRR